MISLTSITNQVMLQARVKEAVKKVSNGGFENTTENIFHKMKNERLQAQKNTEIKGINYLQEKYAEFDNVMTQMSSTLKTIREKLIERNDQSKSIVGTEAINNDLKELSIEFSKLMETKSNTGEKLFGGYSEIVIGTNMTMLRTMPPEFLELIDTPIDQLVQGMIDEEKPNLDDFDKIMDVVNIRHAEIGAKGNILDSMQRFYENQQITSEEFMSKRYKIEEAIAELNDLTLNYEALSKINARVSMLSLVNYV